MNTCGRGDVIVTACVPARCRRSTDDATGLQSPSSARSIGHRAALRDPMGDDIFRAAIDRSLASSKRAGWLNGGRTRRKASGGGIARHDVMGAGVSTHLVCCSTKCAGRAGRPGEEEKLVSCGVSSISIPPLMNENSSPEPKLRSRVKNLNRRISDFPPPVPPRCTFLSIYGL